MKIKHQKQLKLVQMLKVINIAALVAIKCLLFLLLVKNDGFTSRTAKSCKHFYRKLHTGNQLIKSMVIHLKIRTVARDNFLLFY